MVKKKKSKTKAKAGSRRTSKKKIAKKKILKKHQKYPGKKTVKKARKKKSAKKPVRKSATTKAAASRKTAPGKKVSKKLIPVKAGPPAGSIPPVEEPTRQEEAVGIVTHYYSHLGVALVQMNKGSLRTGDTIHIKGHTTDFLQKVESLEFEHQPADQASAGQSFGLKVVDHAREHDIVYLVK